MRCGASGVCQSARTRVKNGAVPRPERGQKRNIEVLWLITVKLIKFQPPVALLFCSLLAKCGAGHALHSSSTLKPTTSLTTLIPRLIIITTFQFSASPPSLSFVSQFILFYFILLVGKEGNALCTVAYFDAVCGTLARLAVGPKYPLDCLPPGLPTKTPLRRSCRPHPAMKGLQSDLI